jgi:hypothetical protein
VTYLERTGQIVAFNVISNGGRSWQLAGVVPIHGAVRLTSRQRTASCSAGPPSTSAPLPQVSAGRPNEWWILREGSANGSIIVTVRIGHGVTAVGHLTVGLPATTGESMVTLSAADLVHAYLGVGNAREVTYMTSDGGSRWIPLLHETP